MYRSYDINPYSGAPYRETANITGRGNMVYQGSIDIDEYLSRMAPQFWAVNVRFGPYRDTIKLKQPVGGIS